MQWTDSVTSIPLVGQSYAKKLEKLGIKTVGDLLKHYPHRYIDRSQVIPIDQMVEGEEVTIIACVDDFKNIYTRNRKNLQQAKVSDESGAIQITWFNQKFLSQAIQVDQYYAFSGKVSNFRGKLSLTAPEFEKVVLDESKQTLHTGRLVPVYPETAGVSSKWLRSRINACLEKISLSEVIPTDIVTDNDLLGWADTVKAIHQPDDTQILKQAKNRLSFQEMLTLQLHGAVRRYRWNNTVSDFSLTWDQKKVEAFISNLPFRLTEAQQQASNEILTDFKKQRPMNRLLEGDVGSGKTIVAGIAAYATHLAGYKTVLMAPTEILAQQHYQGLKEYFTDTSLSVGLKTANQTIDLEADFVIGTHALLYNIKQSNKVALIIVDEQHRFGVEQRAQLEKIGTHPHRLTMSATPIPRTIALTLYGDLDISILDQLPTHRKPVKTWLVPEKKRKDGYKWIKQKMIDGDQVFVVCPLIDSSNAEDFKHIRSAKQEYEYLQSIFPNFTIDLLHGRMKAAEKDQIMAHFTQHKSHMLVSTQVIEVGIDVPNATVMVIEAADRFGLAQLHQLRGRVGRGEKPGFCLLFSSSDQSSRRLNALSRETSGFKLAEFDLKLRGPGEVFGLSQHGYDTLQFANITDKSLIKKTREAAEKLVNKDPHLKHLPYFYEILKDDLKTDISSN